MTAAPRQPAEVVPASRREEMGYAGLRMSAFDFLEIGETQARYELVDGVVFISPSPAPRHGVYVREILKQLARFEDSGGVCDWYVETDVRLSAKTVYRPDLIIYNRPAIGRIPTFLETPPALIFEVLSQGTKAFDLTTKRDDYEKFGVLEYWVVDSSDARVRCYARKGELLYDRTFSPEETKLPSEAIPGFVLDISPLQAIAARE